MALEDLGRRLAVALEDRLDGGVGLQQQQYVQGRHNAREALVRNREHAQQLICGHPLFGPIRGPIAYLEESAAADVLQGQDRREVDKVGHRIQTRAVVLIADSTSIWEPANIRKNQVMRDAALGLQLGLELRPDAPDRDALLQDAWHDPLPEHAHVPSFALAQPP